MSEREDRSYWRVDLLRDEVPTAWHGGAVCLGNFDGVHRGHQSLVRQARRWAHERGRPCIAMTFDPPPAAVLRKGKPIPPLTTIPQRAQLLRAAGADVVLVVETRTGLLQLDATRFVQELLVGKLGVGAVVEGPNFTFGRGRGGSVETLRELGRHLGYDCVIVPPVTHAGEAISSSRIRAALMAGDVEEAARMLGRPYCLRGLVCRGAGRGRGLGFPTANLEFVETLVPGPGVYAATARTSCGLYPAAVHIGPVPTFGDPTPRVEAHLIDFAGDLLGETLELAFLKRLRDVRSFAGPDELRRQLQEDIAATKNVAAKHGTPRAPS